jgi:predicted component of type VI protein secretion system
MGTMNHDEERGNPEDPTYVHDGIEDIELHLQAASDAGQVVLREMTGRRPRSWNELRGRVMPSAGYIALQRSGTIPPFGPS